MISTLAEAALKRAMACCERDELAESEKKLAAGEELAAGRKHAKRSQVWVECFTSELSDHSKASSPDNKVTAFCRSDWNNRAGFRMNELLFDILVAETRTATSPRGDSLHAVVNALWVGESELTQSDARHILIDLNKLVLAKAENKVLVISASPRLVEWTKAAMADLLCPSESGVHLVNIPHPSHWYKAGAPRATAHQLDPDLGWLPSALPESPAP